MNRDYEAYCLVDPLFYDSPVAAPPEDLDFRVARRPVPAGWRRSALEDWWAYQPDGAVLPPQGWKVHVSACLENCEEVLSAVWDYCVPRRLCFKFLRGRHILLLRNSKYAHRGSSGKFVTIYPVDQAALEMVLNELGEALAGEQGPYILSDLRWGAGPLYVRYGGFAERRVASADGELELAIEDANGHLVPDRRDPTFQVPPWVELPGILAPHLTARNTTTVEGLPYDIERALHFSNGGGLYVGRDRRTAEQVVLKEARPYAGLDIQGSDAVARLRREGQVLQRLAGLDVVPAMLDQFTLGDHHFLVQEFVDATPLRALMVQRHPLTRYDGMQGKASEYTSWALDMHARLERAVAAIHDRGIVIGDLHPYNVLVRPDDRIVLIDFEIAAHVSEGRRQTLADPGFVAPRDRTGFAIDEYALACLRLFLFLPLTSLIGLEPAKAEQLAAEIAALFPVPRPFLDDAVRVITGRELDGDAAAGSRVHQRPPSLSPDSAGWTRTRASMAGAILASATPQRDDRLFPGDIQQFDPGGGINLAHGAAGVLYALAVTGAAREPEHEAWLIRRATNPKPGTRMGFFDGLHGVAYVLEHLGYRGEALKVVDICMDEVGGAWERLGTDLRGGLAGIGLNLAHFAAVTGDPSLREAALRVADVVAGRLGGEQEVPTVSGGKHPYAGLLRGSAGPALMFLRLYEEVGDSALLDFADIALRQDLHRCVQREDQSLEVNEGWRTMPYVADGSVGIGLVLDDYLVHREDERFRDAARAIHRAAEAVFYVEPGLFYGRAGMILYLSRRHPVGTAARDDVVAAQVRRLAWHALSFRGDLAFPGEQLLRLSMDLATGTAGVLLAVGAALHDEPVHLPFLEAISSPGSRDLTLPTAIPERG